jgi:hypothetical protein
MVVAYAAMEWAIEKYVINTKVDECGIDCLLQERILKLEAREN